VDRHGRLLGHHRGHRHYTVGQRRGLGVAAPAPLYVLEKDAVGNRVIAGSLDELAVGSVELAPVRLYRTGARVDHVRLRYRSGPVPCSLDGDFGEGEHESLSVTLHETAFGVACGQTACLMEGDLVLGHGTIT
jgi:tRNA-specific 2-thiouridylase